MKLLLKIRAACNTIRPESEALFIMGGKIFILLTQISNVLSKSLTFSKNTDQASCTSPQNFTSIFKFEMMKIKGRFHTF